MRELSNRPQKWKIYALYWAGYVLLFSSIQGFPAQDFFTAFCNELISLLPKIFFVGLVAELLMDRLFLKGKIALFIFISVGLLVIFAVLQRLIDNYIIIEYLLLHWEKEPLFSVPPLLYNIIKLQFVVTIPFSFKLFSHWAKEKSRAHEIEAMKMKTELEFLRNQFHPHFLFNVLNSLYSKILSKSDDSADIVLKISSLLRFSVYELQGKPISLDDEISYLRTYISLQQIRFDNRLDLSFALDGHTAHRMIEPLLLLPFVENSFKYCMSEDDERGWITIFIEMQNDWLVFKIENSFSPASMPDRPSDAPTDHGVGLQQVKRRLELLYPNSHTLKIIQGEGSFFVSLKMKL